MKTNWSFQHSWRPTMNTLSKTPVNENEHSLKKSSLRLTSSYSNNPYKKVVSSSDFSPFLEQTLGEWNFLKIFYNSMFREYNSLNIKRVIGGTQVYNVCTCAQIRICHFKEKTPLNRNLVQLPLNYPKAGFFFLKITPILYPALRMEWTWCHRVFYVKQDWNELCCQVAGKYTHNYKKRGSWNACMHVEMRYDVTSILKVRQRLEEGLNLKYDSEKKQPFFFQMGTFNSYTANLLFHQSPTRYSDYHCDDVVTVL